MTDTDGDNATPKRLPLDVQVPAQHYEHGYDSAERYLHYWHQIAEAAAQGGRILEIGIGGGAVTALLRARALEVTTVDFDRALSPDVVADIRSLPIDDDAFDGVVACEILEHIPWQDVARGLAELRRVSMRWILVSVPSVDSLLPSRRQSRTPSRSFD